MKCAYSLESKLETSNDLYFCELLGQVDWPNRGEQI